MANIKLYCYCSWCIERWLLRKIKTEAMFKDSNNKQSSDIFLEDVKLVNSFVKFSFAIKFYCRKVELRNFTSSRR